MKHRISITINENTLLKLKEKVRLSNDFRNQSHLVELAVENFLREKDE